MGTCWSLYLWVCGSHATLWNTALTEGEGCTSLPSRLSFSPHVASCRSTATLEDSPGPHVTSPSRLLLVAAPSLEYWALSQTLVTVAVKLKGEATKAWSWLEVTPGPFGVSVSGFQRSATCPYMVRLSSWCCGIELHPTYDNGSTHKCCVEPAGVTGKRTGTHRAPGLRVLPTCDGSWLRAPRAAQIRATAPAHGNLVSRAETERLRGPNWPTPVPQFPLLYTLTGF